MSDEQNPSADEADVVHKRVIATGGDDGAERTESVDQPAKLLRIGSMVKEMLEEVRRAPVDEAGRRRLREIHERSMAALREMLSSDLAEELDTVSMPFGDEVPSESELRLAQAQLTGWLEGLFHGIQASFMAQQMQAQGQLSELRRRQLEAGAEPESGRRTGHYL